MDPRRRVCALGAQRARHQEPSPPLSSHHPPLATGHSAAHFYCFDSLSIMVRRSPSCQDLQGAHPPNLCVSKRQRHGQTQDRLQPLLVSGLHLLYPAPALHLCPRLHALAVRGHLGQFQKRPVQCGHHDRAAVPANGGLLARHLPHSHGNGHVCSQGLRRQPASKCGLGLPH